VLLAAIPGMRPKDLELTVHQDTVTISGTLHDVAESEEAKGATWYTRELWDGQIRRVLRLPFPVNADDVQATFENGILKVVMPKSEHLKPQKIAIGGRQPEAIAEGGSAKH
jgi:HSP20 family protein